MNPYTGHLVDREKAREAFGDLEKDGYVEVPQELERAARKKLNGAAEAHVSLNSGGKLAQFAKSKRKNRRRNQIAKEARKRNR